MVEGLGSCVSFPVRSGSQPQMDLGRVVLEEDEVSEHGRMKIESRAAESGSSPSNLSENRVGGAASACEVEAEAAEAEVENPSHVHDHA